MAENCFCHFNGYEVKDANARAGVEANTQAISQANTNIASNTAAIAELSLNVGFVESTEFPGCFYRMVGEEQEWMNPPMVAETEYRTTERHNGRIVYVKYGKLMDLPTHGTSNYKNWFVGATTVRFYLTVKGSSVAFTLPSNMKDQNITFGATNISAAIYVYNNSTTVDFDSGYEVYATRYYIKS